MKDEFEDGEPMGLMKGYNESYRKGYKAAGIEIYERLVVRVYSKEESRELAGVEEEDVEKSTEIIVR